MRRAFAWFSFVLFLSPVCRVPQAEAQISRIYFHLRQQEASIKRRIEMVSSSTLASIRFSDVTGPDRRLRLSILYSERPPLTLSLETTGVTRQNVDLKIDRLVLLAGQRIERVKRRVVWSHRTAHSSLLYGIPGHSQSVSFGLRGGYPWYARAWVEFPPTRQSRFPEAHLAHLRFSFAKAMLSAEASFTPQESGEIAQTYLPRLDAAFWVLRVLDAGIKRESLTQLRLGSLRAALKIAPDGGLTGRADLHLADGTYSQVLMAHRMFSIFYGGTVGIGFRVLEGALDEQMPTFRLLVSPRIQLGFLLANRVTLCASFIFQTDFVERMVALLDFNAGVQLGASFMLVLGGSYRLPPETFPVGKADPMVLQPEGWSAQLGFVVKL